MSTFYSDMERIIQQGGDRALDNLLHYYGLELSNYRQLKSDVYSKVHSVNAGGYAPKVKDFIGIVASDDYSPSTGNLVTKFTSAILYSREEDLLVGDEIRINSADDKSRHYKIIEKESIGLSREIIVRYKLSNIAEL